MLGPIPALVLARLRRRGSTAVIAIAALAAATALVAIVSGIGLVAADQTVHRTLDKVGTDRPVVRVSRFEPTSTNFDEATATAEAAFREHLGGVAGPVVAGVLGSELGDLKAPVFELVVAVDDPTAWVKLTEGRLPTQCTDAAACEAILLSEVPADPDFRVARPAPGVELSIVGRGLIDPAVPFGDLDQRGAFGQQTIGAGDYQTGRRSPAVLLVDGIGAIARSAAFDHSGRTYVWTAPLAVDAVHPWTAASLRDAIGGLTRDLAAADPAYTVVTPMASLDAALARADAGRGRLLIIGSLGVAILLAFAVFLALVVREDAGLEVARLTAIGARRRDRVAFLLLEALIPAVVGGVLGWVLGAAVVAVLAAWSGVAVGPILSGALFGAVPLATAIAVIAVAVLATALATAPGLPRAGAFRGAVALAMTVVVLLGWQLATAGPLDASTLASSIASPIVVLLPPALAFLAALVLTTAMPPVLRALGRRATRAPLPLRLSLLSIAREPGRPAATMTLLAFSLGAIVFAMGWSASLRQGIDDAAAYRSGLDLRVSELGTALSISKSVVPTSRYARLGPDVTAVPVYRDTSTTQPGAAVDLLAIDPSVLPTLPGWRSDFSSTPVTELAKRLELPEPAGGWAVAGHRLPADDPMLDVRFRYDGDPVRLDAIVRTDGGDAVVLPLGTVVDGMTSAATRLPDSAIGGILTTLIFRNDALVAGSGHQHGVFSGTVAFEGLDGLVDERPVPIEIFTTATVIVQAPQATDGVAIPAVVSPDLAREADAQGMLPLHIGTGVVPIRVVGTAERAPTIVETKPRFAILPIDPFLVAVAAVLPSGGRPTEMWIAAPSPQRLAEVRDALHLAPFRFASVTARSDLVAERAADPSSQAIVWALLVAAIAGLILSVGGLILGAVTDLRDERGELADLEAQGVPPSSLRWHALARTAWLAIGGGIAGLGAGVLLAVVATGALAIDAEGRAPLPPLLVVLPPLPIAAVVLGVVLVVLGTVAWLARRTYGRATLGERRGGAAVSVGAAPWRSGPEHVDG